MKIIRSVVTSLSENTYIYINENTKKAIIVDPGGEPKKLLNIIKENDIDLYAILLTHSHIDHIGAISEILDYKKVPICCHEDEVMILGNPEMNLSLKLKRKNISFTPDVIFKDNDIFDFDGTKITVIHTPGHTQGSCCYLDLENNNIFTGDTLFRNSIGRTDLATGNYDSLISSIKDKLFSLDDNINIFPGHGDPSSIKNEKENNSFIF